MPYHPWIYCPECGGKLEEINDGEQLRPYCQQCRRHYYHNPPPVVAVLAVNKNGEVLIVQRGVEPQKGKWSLVTGFMNLLESPQEAALRELEEEAGMKGSIVRLLDCIYQPSHAYGSVVVIGYEVAVDGKPAPGSDALDARFIKPDELPELAFSSHRQLVEDYLSELED